MTVQESQIEPVNLTALSESLMAKAKTDHAHRAAHTIHGSGELLRQTILALADGAELTAHDSPPEATVQVLRGSICLYGKDRQWNVGAGELLQVPPERHSVTALEDTVFLLTVRRDVDPARSAQQGPRL